MKKTDYEKYQERQYLIESLGNTLIEYYGYRLATNITRRLYARTEHKLNKHIEYQNSINYAKVQLRRVTKLKNIPLNLAELKLTQLQILRLVKEKKKCQK